MNTVFELNQNKKRLHKRFLLTNICIISWLGIRFVEREPHDKSINEAKIAEIKKLLDD